VDESLVIGDDIVLTVLAVEGDKVKIGVAAPREIRILRQEIFQAIQEQEQIIEHLSQQEEEPDSFAELRKLLVEVAAPDTETDKSPVP
jgi:carbon storage regulator